MAGDRLLLLGRLNHVNSYGGAWTYVCCKYCVVRQRSLRRADHSSRGVLPIVVESLRDLETS